MWKSATAAGATSTCSLNSCERIRPERARNPVRRLVWGPGAQFRIGYSAHAEDELSCNPRVALGRLLRLYEGRQYREAASFLLRLPRYTFKAALPDIPVDLIVESLPHSLSLLEAVYARLLELANAGDSVVDEAVLGRIEQQVLWRVVHHVSTTVDLRDAGIWSKLLVNLSRLSPGSRKLLASRRRSLERAVEGLGKHGLVPSNARVDARCVASAAGAASASSARATFAFGFGFGGGGGGGGGGARGSRSTGTTIAAAAGGGAGVSAAEPPTTLLPLTARLREELETRLEAYKLALHRIESWGKQSGSGGGGSAAVGTRSKAGDKQVRAASHQRQLSLKYSEVQQRLIDNQSLLNVLAKPNDRNLEDSIVELRRRVERDKEALRQWNAVRKSSGLSSGSGTVASTKNPALAASLLQFSRACSLALRLMNDSGSDASVGHEEKVFGTREENNALGEDRFEGAESSSSAGYHTDDSCSPTPEPLVVAAATATPPTARTGTGVSSGAVLEHTAGSYRWTTEQLTDRYVALHAHAHLHTLDALDALEPLKDATDLKAKILFSVVVLSWRVAEIVQTSRRLEASRVLNGWASAATARSPSIGPTGASSSKPASENANARSASGGDAANYTEELDDGMTRQLARFGYESGTRHVAERVLAELERTLYDFACLKECDELERYAMTCSSLAWICLARESPLTLDVPRGLADFDGETHARHRASPDPLGMRIVAVLWPGLLLSESSRKCCLYRAVVLTDSPRYVN